MGSSSTSLTTLSIIQLGNRSIRDPRIAWCINLFINLLWIPTHLGSSLPILILFLETIWGKAAKISPTRSLVVAMGWCLAKLLIRIPTLSPRTFSRSSLEAPTAVPTQMLSSSAQPGKTRRAMESLRRRREVNTQVLMIQWSQSRRNPTVIKATVSRATVPTRNRSKQVQQRQKAIATFSRSRPNKRNPLAILEPEPKAQQNLAAAPEVGQNEIRYKTKGRLNKRKKSKNKKRPNA